jgi:C4-dicarboxylate-specific signal transduction histidine kinase
MTEHCRKMLGQPPGQEITIDQLLAAVHREDRRVLQQQIERSARWHTHFDTECRILLPDGGLRWLTIKGQTTQSPGAFSDQVTGVVIDVSERKAEQVEAENQRNQLTHLTRVSILGELSGAMAHELNQPLTAILSNAQAGQQLLALDPPDLEEVRSVFDDIVADDLRASEVIRRLRSLLKRDDARIESLDISEVTEDVLDLAASELLTHQVALETELGSELPVVRGDRIQLQQVLLNLVMNACEAMVMVPPELRHLKVTTKKIGHGQIEVVVADSGPGISTEMMEQLFEPFATSKQTGLGLGLSISRAIAAAHNGSLQARNSDGQGAVFSLRLMAEG